MSPSRDPIAHTPSLLALVLLLGAMPLAAAPLAPAGHGSFALPAGDDPVVPLPTDVTAIRAREARAFALEHTALYPTYAWPLQHPNGDGVYIGAYVDDDTTGNDYDYEHGSWTYDTHRGTDISLYDFKAMDRGFRIFAAAPGMVTTAVYANLRDRNCDNPDNPTLNYLEVANGDGTYTYYYHLRANSMTVNVGESISTGQMLGMAGSSGYAFGPHLHFEAADWLSGPYVARDPWGGPGNPKPGLWAAQVPYAGTQPFAVLDMGILDNANAGVDLRVTYPDYCATIAERVQDPVTVGLDEPNVGMWFYPLGHAGQSYTAELREPDGTLYGNANQTFTGDVIGGYIYWAWYWSPYVTQAGTWKARILVGSTVIAERSFIVSASSSYGPRFVKGGRSFRLNGSTTQRDTLHLRPLGAAGTTLALIQAPAFVSLHDSTVTVGPVSDQPFRSRYFQVVASNSLGQRDTAWYHVVDPTKPLDPPVGVGDGIMPAPSVLALSAAPQPFDAHTRIRYALPRAGAVRLDVFDLAGRRVCRLLEREAAPAGDGEVAWEGRDASGRAVPAGIYLARLSVAGGTRTLRLVRMR